MSVKMIVTGLANSGKSAFMKYLVSDSFEIKLNKLSMTFDFAKLNDEVSMYGVRGESFFRSVADQVLQGADAAILLIDSTDHKHFETNMKLAHVLRSKNIPLLLFANKIDMPTSYPIATLENMFNISSELHAGSAITGDGVKEALYDTLTMIDDFEYTKRPVSPENSLLAADGGKSEMLEVFEYFYGYLQELQNYVVSRSYASYDKKIRIDNEEYSQVLFPNRRFFE